MLAKFRFRNSGNVKNTLGAIYGFKGFCMCITRK